MRDNPPSVIANAIYKQNLIIPQRNFITVILLLIHNCADSYPSPLTCKNGLEKS